jgi:pyroglutamyl-peptidase
LLTGFEPFGSHTVNPSELLVRSLEGRVVGGLVVAVRVLPVETRTLRERLDAALAETSPEAVFGTGYAPGRASLALERVALNVAEFDHADASGAVRKNEPLDAAGPDARFATLPAAAIVEAWSAIGIPGYVSNSAGTYLCNQWLYEALALVAARSRSIPCGFIHVPALPAQAMEAGAERTPSMSLELMRKGLETAIEAVALRQDASQAPPPRRALEKLWIPPPRTTRT